MPDQYPDIAVLGDLTYVIDANLMPRLAGATRAVAALAVCS